LKERLFLREGNLHEETWMENTYVVGPASGRKAYEKSELVNA